MTSWETLKAKVAAWIAPVLVLALICALGLSYFEGRKAGAYAVRFKTTDSLLTVALLRADVVDTVWRSDSTAYRLAVALYRHLRDSVLTTGTNVPISGTVAPIDTSVAPVDSGVPIGPNGASCDPIIRAADAAISACAASQAADKAVIGALNRKIDLLTHKPGSSLLSRLLPHPNVGAQAGVGINGKPYAGVGVGFGWTF